MPPSKVQAGDEAVSAAWCRVVRGSDDPVVPCVGPLQLDQAPCARLSRVAAARLGVLLLLAAVFKAVVTTLFCRSPSRWRSPVGSGKAGASVAPFHGGRLQRRQPPQQAGRLASAAVLQFESIARLGGVVLAGVAMALSSSSPAVAIGAVLLCGGSAPPPARLHPRLSHGVLPPSVWYWFVVQPWWQLALIFVPGVTLFVAAAHDGAGWFRRFNPHRYAGRSAAAHRHRAATGPLSWR